MNQRDLVQESVNMADSPEDRHGSYPDRRRQKVDATPELLDQIRVIVREEVQREMRVRGRRAASSK